MYFPERVEAGARGKWFRIQLQRQLRCGRIVDADGRAAAHTGVKCNDWAGHRIGVGFCCQQGASPACNQPFVLHVPLDTVRKLNVAFPARLPFEELLRIDVALEGEWSETVRPRASAICEASVRFQISV